MTLCHLRSPALPALGARPRGTWQRKRQRQRQRIDASLPRWFQLFLGTAEILAAIGITLPGLTRIQPWLVSWAAAGIMIVMVSATIYHLGRSEFSSAAITALLLVMATFVAYMRWRVMPIRTRIGA